MMRKFVGIVLDKIDIDEVGNFIVPRHIYAALEELFGPQNPIYEDTSYVVLEQVKVSRFFRVAVHGGVVVHSQNVRVTGDKWVVDPPDLYEFNVHGSDLEGEHELDSAMRAMEGMIKYQFIAMIRGDIPVTADRKTHVRSVYPVSGVRTNCCVVRPGMTVDGVLGGKLEGTFYIDGTATLYIKPVP